MGAALVAAPCVANRINAQPYFKGLMPPPWEVVWCIVQIKELFGIRDCCRSWRCQCREGWLRRKWGGRAAETLESPSALYNWQIRDRLCKQGDTDDFDTQNHLQKKMPLQWCIPFSLGFFGVEGLELMPAVHKAASVLQQDCSLRYRGVLLAFTDDLFWQLLYIQQ